MPSKPPSTVNVTKVSGSNSQELGIHDVVKIFAHRKKIILIMALAGLAIAALYLVRAPRKYTATATIEINKENSMSLGLDDLSGIGSKLGTGSDLLTDLLTHEADIENDTTAIDVIEKLNLLNQKPYLIEPGKNAVLDRERGLPLERATNTRYRAIHIFQAGLHVTLVKNTRLIGISYTDTDPGRAAAIANTIVEVYLDNHTEARYAASTKTSSWLAGQLDELKKKVEDSEKKVSEFQQQSGLIGVYIAPAGKADSGGGSSFPQVNSVQDQRLIALNTELTNAEVNRIAKEAIYRFAQTEDPEVLVGVGQSSLAAGSGSQAIGSQDLALLESLRQQQSALKLQYSAAITRYGRNNPSLIEIKNQLASVNVQIKTELERIKQRAKSDYDVASIAEAGIQKRVQEQEAVVGKLDKSVAGLAVLEQEEASNRFLYQDLYTRLEEANLTAGLGAGNITIADPARASSIPSSPVKRKVLGLGFALGLFLGALIAVVLDQLQNILYTPEEFAAVTDLPMLGLIPLFSAAQKGMRYGGDAGASINPDATAWLSKDPTSPISEAYRQLRTSILMSRADRPPKTLLFTSVLSKDGKSTTCFNLAAAFAYQGSRVLMIDADLRRPTLHMLAGSANEIGLSSVLTGAVSANDAIQPHQAIENLSILSSGPIPPMPAELLSSRRFVQVLEEMKQQFDYILIDAPPVLLVTDPVLLAPSVEGVVLVARAGVTTKPAFRNVLTILAKPHVAILGYVLNGVSLTQTYYSYYGGGRHGSELEK